jgi:hypothetical protein
VVRALVWMAGALVAVRLLDALFCTGSWLGAAATRRLASSLNS